TLFPSLTETSMPRVTPTSSAPGLPLKRPVVVSNFAQRGLFTIEKLSSSPSASLASGWNEYMLSTTTAVFGFPVMTGGEEWTGPASSSAGTSNRRTATAKLGSDATLVWSVTEMTMLPASPTSSSPGTPCNLPVAWSNCAQSGRLAIENSRTSPSSSNASGWNTYISPTIVAGSGWPQMDGA